MQNRIFRTGYRDIVVCVDSYEADILKGRIYSPGADDREQEFLGLMGLILKIEGILDRMHVQDDGQLIRRFSSRQEEIWTLPEPQYSNGRKGTFVIRILFRQNSSWQGSVLWLEGRMEQSFRSILELALLMDSALHGERGAAS